MSEDKIIIINLIHCVLCDDCDAKLGMLCHKYMYVAFVIFNCFHRILVLKSWSTKLLCVKPSKLSNRTRTHS